MAAMPRLTDAHSANTTIHDASLYAMLLARDARFDGRVFVGVKTTGIYCRHVCRVRTPLARNCRFFDNAPSAEAAGFRPCMRCRPKLAPGLSLVDSSQALAEHAARQIDSAVQQGRDLYIPEVATRLRVTDRHLRRAFQAAHGVTSLGYLSTRRLLLARQLLTDTALPVNEIAHASGFASLRRFNATFQTHYRMSPTGLRRERDDGDADNPRHDIVLRLGYRPPYDVAGVYRRDTDSAPEFVEGPAPRLPVREVLYLKAEQKYVTLRIAANTHVLDDALSDLELRLGAAFVRIHRNALLAVRAVRAVRALVRRGGAEDSDADGWAVPVAPLDEWLPASRRQVAAVRVALAAHGS